MRVISDVFLAETPEIAVSDTGEHETKKIGTNQGRIPAEELELTYINNPVVFNAVNKIVQVIMASPHEIVAEDPKVKAYFENFTRSLGTHGSNTTWESLLTDIFKFQCVYGKSFVENIFNKRHNRIVDWDIIDTKTMDYAKNVNRKVVLDRSQNPVGYFQTLPLQYSPDLMQQQTDVMLPPTVVRPSGQYSIFLKPSQVAQIKLYSIGSGLYPIGIVEPVYRDSLRQMNMETAMANSSYRNGFPIMWAQLGDMNHEPTPQQITSMLEKLKDLNNKSEISTPYYYQLKVLDSGKNNNNIRDELNYYVEQEATGMGIPLAYATGDAGKSNKAVIAKQDYLFQLTISDIIQNTVLSIRQQMFRPICQLEGFKEVPSMKWTFINADELDRKSRRLLKYIEAGLIQPDLKISEFIKKAEALDDEAI